MSVFETPQHLPLKGKLYSLEKPLVMAILNLTPDSFYSHSRCHLSEDLLFKAEKQLHEGATILDLGGYSTRPNAAHISEEEERKRVLPAIAILQKHFPEVPLSIDTFRANIAKEAVEAGAAMVNDISAGSLDAAMWDTVATLQVPYVLMHLRGTPQTMQNFTDYSDIVLDIYAYFQEKIALAKSKGIHNLLIDVGFGFAKTLEQNYQLLQHLDYFQTLGYPLFVGLSRKSMIYKKLGSSPQEALFGTIALNTIAVQKGAKILRVHDSKAAADLIKLLF
jgi:dihydropteroate synthase